MRIESEEAEIVGMDDYEMGEFAYDYVGLEMEIGHRDEVAGVAKDRVNATDGGREPRHHHTAHIDGTGSSAESEAEKAQA